MLPSVQQGLSEPRQKLTNKDLPFTVTTGKSTNFVTPSTVALTNLKMWLTCSTDHTSAVGTPSEQSTRVSADLTSWSGRVRGFLRGRSGRSIRWGGGRGVGGSASGLFCGTRCCSSNSSVGAIRPAVSHKPDEMALSPHLSSSNPVAQ